MAKKPIKKPLWKLEDDGVTYSSLEKWKECPEQFALSWIDGLVRKEISIPLEFGSIMHLGLQHQWKSSRIMESIISQYRTYRIPKLINSTERDTLEYILGLANSTFPLYCDYWQRDDQQLNWIGREEKFRVTHHVPTPQGNREIILRGMRDGIYENSGGVLGIFETKTKTKIIEREIELALRNDMQTMLYAFCTFCSIGRYPEEVTYNVIRRSDTYRRKKEELHIYLRRVEEDIKGRPDHYFKRWTVPLSKDSIEEWVDKTLNPILCLFIQWWDSVKKNPLRESYWEQHDPGGPGSYEEIQGRWSSPYHYLNSSALVGRYGKVEMWDAIFGDMRPYRIRSTVFPELEESFQVTFDDTDL